MCKGKGSDRPSCSAETIDRVIHAYQRSARKWGEARVECTYHSQLWKILVKGLASGLTDCSAQGNKWNMC
jgi:hypothetical protein